MLIGFLAAAIIVFAPRTGRGHLIAYLIAVASVVTANLLMLGGGRSIHGVPALAYILPYAFLSIAFYTVIVGLPVALFRRVSYGYWWFGVMHPKGDKTEKVALPPRKDDY